MQQTRTQRVRKYISFDFTPGCDHDVMRYTPDGHSFKLEIFPRLSSYFPNMEVTFKTKIKAPKNLYFTRGGLLHLEIEDKEYFVFCCGLAGMCLYPDPHMEETEYQMAAVVMDKAGQIMKTTVGPKANYSDDGANFANFAVQKMEFDRSAKKLDFKAMQTKIEPVNVKKLSHHFLATVDLPGGGRIQILREVAEIHNAGKNADSSFQFWVFGYSWQVLDKVGFIGQDSLTGRYHSQVFTNGALLNETHSSDFEQTVMSCASVLYA